jgi:hypothetical protein
MMIGYNHIDSRIAGRDDGVMAAGTAIGGDNQLYPVGQGVVADMMGLQAVALFYSMGDIGGYVGSDSLQKIQKYGRGGDAVNIVVAKY